MSTASRAGQVIRDLLPSRRPLRGPGTSGRPRGGPANPPRSGAPNENEMLSGLTPEQVAKYESAPPAQKRAIQDDFDANKAAQESAAANTNKQASEAGVEPAPDVEEVPLEEPFERDYSQGNEPPPTERPNLNEQAYPGQPGNVLDPKAGKGSWHTNADGTATYFRRGAQALAGGGLGVMALEGMLNPAIQRDMYDATLGPNGMLTQAGEAMGLINQGPEGLNQEGPLGPDIAIDPQVGAKRSEPNIRDVNQATRLAKNMGVSVEEAYGMLTGYDLNTGENLGHQGGEVFVGPAGDNMGGASRIKNTREDPVTGQQVTDFSQQPVLDGGMVDRNRTTLPALDQAGNPGGAGDYVRGSRRATPAIVAATRQKQLDEQAGRENLLKYRNMLSPQTSMQGAGRAALNAQAMLLSGETPMGDIPEDMRQAMIYQAFPTYANAQAQSLQNMRQMAEKAGFGTGMFGRTAKDQVLIDAANRDSAAAEDTEAERLVKSLAQRKDSWFQGIRGALGGDFDFSADDRENSIQKLMARFPGMTYEKAAQLVDAAAGTTGRGPAGG
jgi:hypothetical protein